MLKTWHTLKGYVAVAVSFIACPCHLPITLPLLVSLTAGTAFSVWLAENKILVGVISTVVFFGGAALALKWFSGPARPARRDRFAGMTKVTLITSPACREACENARAVWREVRAEHRFKFEEIDIASPHGRELAARHNIFITPTTLVDDRVAFRSVPKRDHAAARVRG